MLRQKTSPSQFLTHQAPVRTFSVAFLFLLLASAFSQELTSVPDGNHTEASAAFLSDKSFPEKTIQRIAFGSCNRPPSTPHAQRDPNVNQDFWGVIQGKNPELMLLLGDNHYAESTDPTVLKAAYDELATIDGFMNLRKTCPTLATWDNHDYGAGYLGKAHPNAQASEDLFLDHFCIPQDDVRRTRTGIYGAWTFGEANCRVQVIMLDLMRNRDPLADGTEKRYFPPHTVEGSSILGDIQWAWLEEQLQQEADVRIIGSSLQVLSNEHFWRRWGMFPFERNRFLQLIRESKGTSILLSGDRHRGEVSALPIEGEEPLYDITASAFNSSFPAQETNSLRVGPLIQVPNFGWMEIDWEKRSVTVQLLAPDNTDQHTAGEVLLTQIINIKQPVPVADPFKITKIFRVPGTNDVTIEWNPIPGATADTSYNIEWSDDLKIWNELATGIDSMTYTHTDGIGADKKFYRIVLVNPTE